MRRLIWPTKRPGAPGVTREAKDLVHHGVSHRGFASHPSFVYNIPAGFDLSRAEWVKVKNVRPGMEIAVVKGGIAVWDRIAKIEILPEEQVYDIEVEGTHNFVGNGIVAHNTAVFNSNVE